MYVGSSLARSQSNWNEDDANWRQSHKSLGLYVTYVEHSAKKPIRMGTIAIGASHAHEPP